MTPAPAPAPAPPPDASLVFNVVWTGGVFEFLRYFTCSLIDTSAARFRFVGNGCTPDSIAEMERFAEQRPDRVVEVLPVSEKMVAHGVALDTVFRTRHDGEHFCFVDPDIRAVGPWVGEFAAELTTAGGVTSGRGVWCETDVVPPGHPGVSGEYFYSQSGFLFGSPHFAMYRRDPLDDTRTRWDVGFGSAGPDLSDTAKKQLAAGGHEYLVYDTGKILNILFQDDGNVLSHFEHPNLMHIGGMSHYLSPDSYLVLEEGADPVPEWARWANLADRFEVARFTAAVLHELCEERNPPTIPDGLAASMEERLTLVRDNLVDLVGAHRSC